MAEPKLILKTLMDNTQLKSGVSEMNSIVSKGASKVGELATKGAVAIGAAVTAGTAAATALVKKAVDGYATYEQLVGGVETLFGAGGQNLEAYAKSTGKTVDEVSGKYSSLMNAQNTVLANAAIAYKTAGMSANEYMDTVTSFSASLVASLGGDTEKAAQYADRALIDMSDNANKMGTNMRDIQNAYQGFAKQNYTMLDNLKLGYGGTQEEMKRLIADASKMTDVQAKLGVTVDSSSLSFGNIVNAISVVQENMGIAGTTTKEAASTIEGSVNMMKASWENLVVGMADDNANLDVLIQNFVESALAAADNLLPRIEVAISGLGDLIEKLLPVIMEKVPQIIADTAPKLVNAGIGMVGALATGIMDNSAQIMNGAEELLLGFMDGLAANLPQIIQYGAQFIGSLLAGIGESLPALAESAITVIETLGQSLADNFPLIQDGFSQLLTGISIVIEEYLPQIIENGVSLIENLVSGFVEAIPVYLPQILTFIQSFADFLAEKAPDVIQWGFDMLSQLVDGIISAIPILVEQLPQIITTFANIINDNFPTILQKGVELLWQLITGILSCIPDIIANIPQIVEAIISVIEAFDWLSLGKKIITFFKNGIVGMVSAAESAGKTIFEAIKNAIKNLPETLKNLGKTATKGLGNAISSLGSFVKSAAVKIGEHVISGVKSLPEKMLSIGKNLIKGLWNGISDMTGWILDKVKGFASGVIDKVKGVFGIHSPSREFKWIGKMCVEGFDEPIDDYDPYDSLNKSIKASAATMKANFVGSGSYAENYAAGYDYDAAARANASALKGMTVNMDGRRVGKLVTPYVDRFQGEMLAT